MTIDEIIEEMSKENIHLEYYIFRLRQFKQQEENKNCENCIYNKDCLQIINKINNNYDYESFTYLPVKINYCSNYKDKI